MFIFGNLRLQTRSLCQQHSVILTEWKSSLGCQVAALAGGGRTWQWVYFPGATWRCAFSAPSGESLHWRAQTRRDSPLYLNIRDSPLYLNIRDSPLYLNIRDSPLYLNIRDSPLYLNIRDSPLYLNIRDSPLYLNIRGPRLYLFRKEV